ncbi:hypothetical protein, partial [Sporisorium scitamineum]
GNYRHRPAATATATATRCKTHGHKLDRKPTSFVALASPTRFAHEKQARVVVHPQRLQPAATLRPLPVPPPFTLPK